MKLHIPHSLLSRMGLGNDATGQQVVDGITNATAPKRPPAVVPAADTVPDEISAFRAQNELYAEVFPARATAAETAALYTAAENEAYYALFPEERP